MSVTKERTNWRDQKISARHRLWGKPAQCLDIDFLLIEHTHGKPRALIEYKCGTEAKPMLECNRKAFRALADAANIPAFVCRYSETFVWFYITPLNHIACDMVPESRYFTEYEYVELLYRCLGKPMPDGLFDENEQLQTGPAK